MVPAATSATRHGWLPISPGYPRSPASWPSAAGVSYPSLSRYSITDDLDYLPARPDVTLIPSVGSWERASRRVGSAVGPRPRASGGRLLLIGGEAAVSWDIASICARRQGPSTSTDVMGYWRQDSAAWGARGSPSSEKDFLATYQQAIADGKSDKAAAQEEFDDASSGSASSDPPRRPATVIGRCL